VEDILAQEKTSLRQNSMDAWTVLPFLGNKGAGTMITYGDSYAIHKSTAAKQLAAWLFVHWLEQPSTLAQFVEATGSLPLRKSELLLLEQFSKLHPDWQKAVEWLTNAGQAPKDPDWYLEKMVLQDALWQTLQANKKPEDIPAILKQLDAAVQDAGQQIH